MMVPGTARAPDQAGPIRARLPGVRPVLGRLRRCAVAAIAILAALPAGAAPAHEPEAPLRIPLAPLGYQAMVPELLLSGKSMLTVHFVDSGHLLITFNVRRLMKREVDPPPDDDDQMIAAFLVDLPFGKVLARTEWRVHDRGQYLWSLGHGRFLLRVRDRLTIIAPMDAANSDDAFHEVPLAGIDRHVVAILVSPDNDLLTVESTRQPTDIALGPDPAPVLINFYRLIHTGPTMDGLRVSPAGAIRTPTAEGFAITTGGFLEVLEGGKDRWLFNFDEHAGNVDELAEWDTSCAPLPTFIGHSEFVAFGCRGSADRLAFAGFNLKGEQMWQQSFSESQRSPTFAFAPEAGRFALGRTIVGDGFSQDFPLQASGPVSQEVRVYQGYNGRILFKIDCSPVERAGQNFALSADGLRFAVVRETMVRHPATEDYDAYTQREAAVEVYTLPPLTDNDRAAVKAAQAQAPADTGARVDLVLQRVSAKNNAAEAITNKRAAQRGQQAGAPPATGNGVGIDAGADAVSGLGSAPSAGTSTAPGSPTAAGASTAAEAPVTAGAPATAGAPTVVEGDPDPSAPRKPPTLYGPDEKQPQKQQQPQ